MIRFTHLKGSPGDVAHYAQNERDPEKAIGYYSEKGGAPSQWLGQGAEIQGLSGPVNQEKLEQILSGVTMDGEDISQRGGHSEDRRMGSDLTISAPKSVSIMAVVDDRIAQIHDQAVAKAAQYLEQDMVHARIGKGGAETQYTGHLVAAAFRHEDSRSDDDGRVDPHLHTHVITANMTQRADGKWVSARLDLGTDNNRLLTMDAVYKAELARGLKSAGYALEQTKDGFEIKGITREQIDAFSSRSQEIKDDLAARGVDRKDASEKQRTAAQNATRKGKTQLSRDDQRWEWRERFRAEGIHVEDLIQSAHDRSQSPEAQQEQGLTATAEQAVASASLHLGERNTVFTQSEIEKEAMQDSMGNFDLRDVRAAIQRKSGELLDAGSLDRDGTGKTEQRFTTQAHLEREWDILQRAKNGQGKVQAVLANDQPEPPIEEVPCFIQSEKEQHYGHTSYTHADQRYSSYESGPDRLESLSQHHLRSLQGVHLDAAQERKDSGVLPDHAGVSGSGHGPLRWASEGGTNGRLDALLDAQEIGQGFRFSDGQRAGVELALTSPDRYMGIVGYAGAGKTTSMEMIVDQYKRGGYEVIGLAPSAAAARELEAAGCHETRTLASELLKEREPGPGKRLYLLDEAGMVSSKDFQALLQKSDREGARGLFVGDPSQLQSVESGAAFKQLLDSGSIQHVKIDEIQRQKDPQLKAIAQAFAEGRGSEAVALAKPYMRQVQVEKGQDKSEVLSARAAQAYLCESKEDRDKTLLLVGTNRTRQLVNQKVRDGLVERREVSKESVTVTTLQKSDMTREQAQKAYNFTPGMVVEFQGKGKWGDKGSQWDVVGNNEGKLVLSKNQKTIEIDPRQTKISAYEKKDIDLAQGDLVMFGKNDKDRDLRNGDVGKVVSVDQETGAASIRLQGSGQVITVDKKKGEVLDYAYARTVHKSQGATFDKAIVVGEGGKTATANLGYVALSREKTGLQIITADTEKLSKSWSKFAERETAIKSTGKEINQKLPDLEKARNRARDPEPEIKPEQKKQQQKTEIPKPFVPKKKKEKDKGQEMEMEL